MSARWPMFICNYCRTEHFNLPAPSHFALPRRSRRSVLKTPTNEKQPNRSKLLPSQTVRTSLNKIRKLKNTTAVEVKTRLSQKIAAFSERAGVSSDIRLPSNAEFRANCIQPYSEASLAEDLLHDFRSHAGTRFFTSLRDSIDLRECLNSVLSEEDHA